MSPKVKAERFGTRDLCYSQWHRKLPHSLTMIDVDGLEYCQRCRSPLAVIETARDVGQPVKPATVLTQLARTAGIEAYVLIYTVDEDAKQREDWESCITAFRWKRVYPNPEQFRTLTPQQAATNLAWIHSRHGGTVCRGSVAS